MLVSEAIQSFIIARTADGRASRTIRDHHRVLGPFAAWCADRGIPVELLTREQVREYVTHLRGRGWSDGTLSIHIRNLRAFLRWLHEEGYTADNLAKAVKAPRRIARHEDPLRRKKSGRSSPPARMEALKGSATLLLSWSSWIPVCGSGRSRGCGAAMCILAMMARRGFRCMLPKPGHIASCSWEKRPPRRCGVICPSGVMITTVCGWGDTAHSPRRGLTGPFAVVLGGQGWSACTRTCSARHSPPAGWTTAATWNVCA